MKSLEQLQADALAARERLAHAEAQFAEWRAFCAEHSNEISPTEYGEILDCWIRNLGEIRHAEAAATKVVVANTPKLDQ
jgi:hypothetical protein